MIERALDMWWDPKEQCVVTKVDMELEDLLNQDTDLMFYEEDMEIDLTGITKEETAAKDVGMSTDSISTFQMAATKKQNTAGYIPPTTTKTTKQDQASVIMGMSMSESEFSTLLEKVTQALQTQASTTKALPSGDKTGKPP